MDYPNSKAANNSSSESTTPICRCRVVYLGSAVPHLTKDGLQGVQEPLKELYPEVEAGVTGLNLSTSAGIDSWISVWSNGILIENVDDFGREVRRFFPIESLHYCAAVRYVNLPDSPGLTKFLPLDSPYLVRHAKSNHPPLFACILRRTTGIKVLECHAFVCKRETAANTLVRCCFHAYADNEYVRQMDESPYAQINNRNNKNKDQLDGVNYTSNWGDGTDVTDSDHTASSTQQTQKLNSIQNHNSLTTNSKKLTNGKANGFKSNIANELNSDDTEIMTTNSSLSQNSPEEDEEVALMNKIWPTSKSLSGSVKNLNLSKEAVKIAKGASMRSLRPRQMVIPNMLPPPMSFIPIHAMPHYPPQLVDGKPLKGKLLKKMKSKSMITLVPQSPSTPIPPHAIPIGHTSQFFQQHPQFAKQQQQMMFINHPANLYGTLPPQMLPPMFPTPQPITGNIHSIKKKSKKNKEKQQLLQQQLIEMQHRGPQPIFIPPMRPLTPLANYLGNQSPINSAQKYLIQTIGPHNSSIYHTAPRNRKEKQKTNDGKKDKKISPINANELQQIINNQNNLNNYQNQQQSNNRSNSNSPFNTGIYRKKSHPNERSFLESLIQEHISRSNSVANLNFNQDELDHNSQINHQQEQYLLNGSQRKISQNGSAILNNSSHHNSNSSQGSPSSISKQQQLARQQQYFLQQQQLSDALNNLHLNAQPKTASIKRSKLSNNNLLFHNGQMNNGGVNKLKNGFDIPHLISPVYNGKLVLPHQNGNIPQANFESHLDLINKKKSNNGKLLNGH